MRAVRPQRSSSSRRGGLAMNHAREEKRENDRPGVGRARLRLAALLGGILVCLAVAPASGPEDSPVATPGRSLDFAVFQEIVARVREGESFYEATQDEL